MATSTTLQYFFLLCLLLFSVSPTLSNDEFPETGFITLPVKKDSATLQYYTSIGIGTPQNNMNLAIDLSGKFLWYDCDTHYDSSSYLPVPCDSQTCPQNSPCTECNGFPPKPGCTNNTCGLGITNPFADTVFSGDMGEDLLHMPPITVPRSFISGCADSDRFTTPLLSGLANGTKGILGLARSHIFSLPNQISSSYNVPPKFTLCLPSNNEGTGKIFITRRPFSPDPVTQIGLSANSQDESTTS
ncbi:probable aspartic proteinase GIP2 [Lotus japonicus]|uniref:probable aspartic proteinase GIP2 n=1 Tax=Lotus japonicus TaxID=34305 RepID=UPI002588EE86|nr:probable aspartic proteinase GIP2 [Lotus japonicus]